MSPKAYNPYVVSAAATIGGMLFGFDVSSVAAFVNNQTYRAFFNYPSDVVQGAITSAMAAGSFFGSLISGRLSDHLGRKYAIQSGAAIWILGAIIQTTVVSTAQLIIGRFIGGIAIGICSSQVPVYIAELSPKKIRGRLVGTFQWAITWGVLIMFFIGYACSFLSGNKSFRIAWGLQIIPGAVLFGALLFFPESPRWLATRDRWDEAHSIIAHIHGSRDLAHPEVLLDMDDIREVVRIDRLSKKVSLADLFAPDSRRRTIVGCMAQFWQQVTGINVMMYYVVYTFAMAGYDEQSDLIASLIQYLINVVMTFPALLFIDNWGRRPLFLIGSVLMAICLFLVTIIMGHYGHYVDSLNGNTEIKWVVPDRAAAKAIIAFNYLFVAAFAPTWGPATWIYVSEIFPLKQRATANGLCAAVNWASNCILAFFVPLGFKRIQYLTYLIFAFFCIAMTAHVYFAFPETKGKTLEEIDLIWINHVAPWKSSAHIPVPRASSLSPSLSPFSRSSSPSPPKQFLDSNSANTELSHVFSSDNGSSLALVSSSISYDTDAVSLQSDILDHSSNLSGDHLNVPLADQEDNQSISSSHPLL
ncbi:uncharacterized protein V1516DRAFT_657044 [Lipomyces oligophaga]|uniref:uncharacterized protein n=1 Tax=Lipomyces oligophaga TaxID=45792 RepID=UPI0034CD7BEA